MTVDDGRFYLLRCRTCGDDLPMPFPSAQARGEWARKHTEGTGHDDWWVADHGPAEPTRPE